MQAMRRVAILGGVRVPFCRNNTAYFDIGNLGLSTIVLGGLVEKFQLQGQILGEVAMGAVLKHSSDFNLAREAALSSGLSPHTPGITITRACGTGLDSLITVANKIAVGQIEAGIGGGSDTTSDVPIAVSKKLRCRLLDLNRARTLGERIKAALKGFSFGELKPEFPGVADRAPAKAWARAAKTWPNNGRSAVKTRMFWPMNPIRKPPPPMREASMPIWYCRFAVLKKTTSCVRTTHCKNWPR